MKQTIEDGAIFDACVNALHNAQDAWKVIAGRPSEAQPSGMIVKIGRQWAESYNREASRLGLNQMDGPKSIIVHLDSKPGVAGRRAAIVDNPATGFIALLVF